MRAVDFRDATWADIESRLHGLLRATWDALVEYGPCTTRQLADASEIDILNVRPRVHDLCTLGLARLAPGPCQTVKGEGVYEAVGLIEAREQFEAVRRGEQAHQLDLRITA